MEHEAKTDDDLDKIIRIDGGYFCAGVILGRDDRVEKTAPILKYMKGWDREKVESYCRKKKWNFMPL